MLDEVCVCLPQHFRPNVNVSSFSICVGATFAKVGGEIEELKPPLVIGSQMCSAKDLEEKREAASAHLEFPALRGFRTHNLAQRQVGNSSVRENACLSIVELRRGDQCRFDRSNCQMVSAREPTGWLSTSLHILERVAKRSCGGQQTSLWRTFLANWTHTWSVARMRRT